MALVENVVTAGVLYQDDIDHVWIETDDDYDLTLGSLVPSSGTALVEEQIAFHAVSKFRSTPFFHKYSVDLSVSTAFEFLLRDAPLLEALKTKYFVSPFGNSGSEVFPAGNVAAATWLANEPTLQVVASRARKLGLHEIADRLTELGQQSIDEGEQSLQIEPAECFIEYCFVRGKKGRPLMTATPAGELDITWKGPEGQRLAMRFFSNKSVWVAYKLIKGRGSFEATLVDLLDLDFDFKIPDWA